MTFKCDGPGLGGDQSLSRLGACHVYRGLTRLNRRHCSRGLHVKNYKAIILLFVGVIFIQIVAGYAISTQFTTWPERGAFGDMFGAVNTLFSGLAFVGVIYAIFLQSQELELQRKELELTRNELSKSASAQAEQAKLLLHTAKINAVSSKLDTYTTLMVNKRSVPGGEDVVARKHVAETLEELEALLDKCA
jgi:hypothetical protein